jgi:hypothetical protein
VEAASTSAMPANFYQTTGYKNPEDSNLQGYCTLSISAIYLKFKVALHIKHGTYLHST